MKKIMWKPRKFFRSSGSIVLFVLFFLLLFSCERHTEPLEIGLSVNLSGTGGAAGEHVRNGVQLAVREINKAGGINGRPLKLIIKDDTGTPKGAVAADKQLVRAGVPVIVGHNRSSTTLAGYPVVTSHGILLMTACSATTRLTGKKDFFVRTCVDCNLYGKKTAKLLQDNNIHSVAFLMDMANPGFVTDYARSTAKYFPGQISKVLFRSGNTEDWDRLIKKLIRPQPDAVILLTEATMTGMALQKLKFFRYRGMKIATLWTQTPELFKYSGGAAEGLNLVTYVNPELDSPEYKRFQKKMESHFHEKANARSASSYELMMILARAMRSAENLQGKGILKALISRKYQGLMGTVAFDEFGDVIRPVYQVQVRGGRFVLDREI